jgi:hypothetical protein
MPTHPEMSAPLLALYLRRNREADITSELQAIAEHANDDHPGNDATLRIIALTVVKAARGRRWSCR